MPSHGEVRHVVSANTQRSGSGVAGVVRFPGFRPVAVRLGGGLGVDDPDWQRNPHGARVRPRRPSGKTSDQPDTKGAVH